MTPGSRDSSAPRAPIRGRRAHDRLFCVRIPLPILLLASLLCGCGSGCDPPGQPAPEACDRFAAADAGWGVLEPREVVMGSGAGDAFVPYVADGDVELVSGGQGAFMIVPVVRAPADGVERTCWDLRIVNRVEGGPSDLPELQGAYVFTRRGDFLYTDPLFDLLAYGRDEVEGRGLTLELAVTGSTSIASQTIRVIPR